MQRKTFKTMLCPVARTLDRVGEWWSILILRDAFHGLTRFDQFQTSLDIAPNMLTRRLNALVEAGLLERRRYSERPPRHEYVLTDRGRDFWSVLVALTAYGNRHFAEGGTATQLLDAESGKPVDAVLTDRATGRLLDQRHFKFGPGPAADAAVRSRMRYADARRASREGRDEWETYSRLKQEAKARHGAKRRASSKRP
jgi:DNA-binding HxlR family transcriptional regulator